MEDSTRTYRCNSCGTPLGETGADGLCTNCASLGSGSGRPASCEGIGPPTDAEAGEDPDHPRWSVASGIGVWVFSIVTLLVTPFVAILLWSLLLQAGGQPSLDDPQQVLTWLESPKVVLVSVVSSGVAHLLTLAICWAVVTGVGRAPLLQGLGWSWNGPSLLVKIVFVIGTTLLMLAISFALDRALPHSGETAFDRLLKTSHEVRVAVALLAVFSAPIVEEIVYRGVLYSALRSRIGVIGAVIIVTSLFGSVHFFQYWGAWSLIIGITLLSLVLTVTRAVTRSIKPCVAIHLLINAVAAVVIVRGS